MTSTPEGDRAPAQTSTGRTSTGHTSTGKPGTQQTGATVRPATEVDIPALHALDEWPPERAWRRLIGNEEVLVVEVEGQIVGLLHYTVLWATVPFLSLIVLQESVRGRGLSRVLVDDLVRRLKEQGYVALLSSSQTDEPEPQAWHRHLGFTSNGIIENIADEGIGEVVFRLSFED